MTRLVRDIMTKDVITADSRDSIYDVASKMRDNMIGFIPITQDFRPVGVITDRDLVVRGYAEQISYDSPVSEVMTREVITIDDSATAEEAVNIMSENKIRRLVITEGNRITGVIAIGDLAVRRVFVDEAGQALSDISTPTRQQLQ
ncbi:MAG: CBS domain-containing protein [Christensenellales bacterium]|jgi:CBS domain-containing protein